MGMAEQGNSVGNKNSECCSDVGLKPTCHLCEHGKSKMNGIRLLIRLVQKRVFFHFLVQVLFGLQEQ